MSLFMGWRAVRNCTFCSLRQAVRPWDQSSYPTFISSLNRGAWIALLWPTSCPYRCIYWLKSLEVDQVDLFVFYLNSFSDEIPIFDCHWYRRGRNGIQQCVATKLGEFINNFNRCYVTKISPIRPCEHSLDSPTWFSTSCGLRIKLIIECFFYHWNTSIIIYVDYNLILARHRTVREQKSAERANIFTPLSHRSCFLSPYRSPSLSKSSTLGTADLSYEFDYIRNPAWNPLVLKFDFANQVSTKRRHFDVEKRYSLLSESICLGNPKILLLPNHTIPNDEGT